MSWTIIVNDTFNITGRGLVVTGDLLSGNIRTRSDVGREICLYYPGEKMQLDSIVAFELPCISGSNRSPSVSVGVLLKELKKEDIKIGCVIFPLGKIRFSNG